MILRREQPTDISVVHQIHVAAFQRQAGEEPMEARLLEALRMCDSWQDRFSLVVRSSDVGIEPPQPEWHEHFQVRALSSYRQTIRGGFVYASPFRTVQ